MQTEAAAQATKRPSPWKIAAHVGLVLLLVGIFAWQIHENWAKIVEYRWHPDWALAILALGLLLITSGLDILIWNRTLGWFTDPLPFRQGAAVYIWSYLARYIPGKVPSLIIRAALATEVKRHPVPVLASSAVELALRTASAFLLFLVTLSLGVGGGNDRRVLVGALIITPLVLVGAHPKIMLPVMNWALRVIKQPTITKALRYREVLGIFMALFVRWVIYGLSFAILVWAVARPAGVDVAQALKLIGVSTGAWAIGFIIPSPGGLGITEEVQHKLLHAMGYLSPLSLVLPVLSRLWTLIAEGLWSLVALLLWRMQPREQANEERPASTTAGK